MCCHTGQPRYRIWTAPCSPGAVSYTHLIGIPRGDVYIDCLTLTVSAEQSAAAETLKAITTVSYTHLVCIRDRPQTLRYFEQMQERIVSFVAGHSGISAKRFTQLMHNTGELVKMCIRDSSHPGWDAR